MLRVGRLMVAQLEELYRTRRGDFCRAAAAISGESPALSRDRPLNRQTKIPAKEVP
jgi:hypothetical protein